MFLAACNLTDNRVNRNKYNDLSAALPFYKKTPLEAVLFAGV
jgi:hypothetical protein